MITRREFVAGTSALAITAALSSYPPVPEFTDLMRRLSVAIDAEAAALAARPIPGSALARA